MRNIKFFTFFLVVMLMASSAFAFKPIELGEGKYLKFFYEGQFGVTMRNTGSGDQGEDDTADFNFRRNRFGFIGTYNDKLSFYLQTEYLDDKAVNPLGVKDSLTDDEKFYVLDAQIRYAQNNAFNVTLGKFKHNLTRENLEGCFTPLNFDRSLFVAAPFKTSRDYGVAVWGNLANDYLQYRLDVMEGRESGGEGNVGSYVPNSGFRYTGRLHFTMFDKETGYGYQGSYLGEKKILTVGGSYQYEADVAFKDATNRADAVDYSAYSLDFFTESS
ncbi:MAG: OprO/OprP family phosphate-selective porin [Geovibrio sp.]|nr:OprO/OprP family phosphate-selective porin [Geovibrio sp.]